MIHPTAIIDAQAEISDTATIGPYVVIGPNVTVGPESIIEPHVVIRGPTTIGARNHIYQFSTVGEATPDLKYHDEPTELVIGNDNIIRENVTIHRGTVQDRGITQLGDHNLIMAYVHVGHDSIVGNNTILVNNTALAGHVVVGDWAILSGYTLVHQFCKIGAHSFSGMGTAIGKDVPAFVTVAGSPAEAKTINSEGLRRRGFSSHTLAELRRAYKIIYRQGLTLDNAVQRLEGMVKETPELQMLIDSLSNSERGIVR
ncbi:MAG: acyl-ACP--UDP-N-acetylglucosamine O-acyltransferase [Halieaceae bacterium]|nr:acyl-ACP--UDP-N-acetylglucosamine O-acyltransferase [Halieaceae bacterium]MBT5207915.1 acyl-ACP--UDP-N-acetylglucosamine O-acyltransferase [Halieaceae bacterium]MBT6263911.1 acyl-ACP--UDP-N-acetylglucosamine O-acyltransferase [Halieaceae bacterium]MBT6333512.1 acyl-ACP--UDP-N-acetylglucosamine O-acyltransferase [Halieaceae bacterium]MBT7341501.1 acyl-ACP--UDP-N-acetylglucosamine O-acyltransferase [Halieaceae bacterium]